MATKQSSLAGNIREFEIFQAKEGGGGKSIDASEAIVDIKYYEDVLSNSVSLTATVVESGETDKKDVGNVGILDGLPIRGGEPAHIVIEDHDKNKLKFKRDNKLYVNRVKNVLPGTSKDVYSIDFAPRELFANEQCRVVRRYDGKISDNIREILSKETSKGVGIKTKKKLDIDETALKFNFIGNDRKPFYVCTWLASKSVPAEAGSVGGAAGYLFYETYDGFNFKSIDVLFDKKKNKPKGNYIFTNTDDNPKSGQYKGKILSYEIDRDIDLQNQLVIGAYSNRTLFFDFKAYSYQVQNFSVDPPIEKSEGEEGERTSNDSSKGKIETLGKDDLPLVSPEFRKPISRLMNRVLDIGVLVEGKTTKEQLEKDKEKPLEPNFDVSKSMVQSVMRYNQMFSIKINIMIAGNFKLRAGDLIYCEFPQLSTEPNTQPNKKSGGLYMISSLCHNLTPRATYTSLTLVRDTFGRTPLKDDSKNSKSEDVLLF